MSLQTNFWKFYNLIQREILRLQEKDDESFMMPEKQPKTPESIIADIQKVTTAIGPWSEESQRHCAKNCRMCKSTDLKSCEFFYACIVFGDELFIRAFDLHGPVLEQHYFNTAQGGYFLSRKMDDLAKKLDWSAEEKELAYVYYYMLVLGFQAAAQGEYAEKRKAMVMAFENKLPDAGRAKDNLTPAIYNSIKKTQGKMNKLPSLKATIVWAACALVGVLLVFNAVWSLCTAKIQKNLDDVHTTMSKQVDQNK